MYKYMYIIAMVLVTHLTHHWLTFLHLRALHLLLIDLLMVYTWYMYVLVREGNTLLVLKYC